MRLLAVLPLVPYPPDRGDRMRAWEMITALSSFGELTVAIVASDATPDALAALHQIATDVQWYRLETQDMLLGMAHGVVRGCPVSISRYWSEDIRDRLQGQCCGPWDLLLAYQLRAAPYALGLRSRLRVLDLTDSRALYRRRLPWDSRGVFQRLALSGVESLEARMSRQFDACWISTSDDASSLEQRAGIVPQVIPNGCRPVLQPRPFRSNGPLVFVGDMHYLPNEDAIVSFVRNVWPVVRRKHRDLRLRIIGRTTRAVAALHRTPGIQVTGFLSDVARELEGASAVINPVRFGTGSSRKVLGAWAAGRPVISTRAGVRGLLCRDRDEVMLAETPDEWCASFSWLIDHPADAERLGHRGWVHARTVYDAQVIWHRAFSSALETMRARPVTTGHPWVTEDAVQA